LVEHLMKQFFEAVVWWNKSD